LHGFGLFACPVQRREQHGDEDHDDADDDEQFDEGKTV
jgi:hypothetical protein